MLDWLKKHSVLGLTIALLGGLLVWLAIGQCDAAPSPVDALPTPEPYIPPDRLPPCPEIVPSKTRYVSGDPGATLVPPTPGYGWGVGDRSAMGIEPAFVSIIDYAVATNLIPNEFYKRRSLMGHVPLIERPNGEGRYLSRINVYYSIDGRYAAVAVVGLKEDEWGVCKIESVEELYPRSPLKGAFNGG